MASKSCSQCEMGEQQFLCCFPSAGNSHVHFTVQIILTISMSIFYFFASRSYWNAHFSITYMKYQWHLVRKYFNSICTFMWRPETTNTISVPIFTSKSEAPHFLTHVCKKPLSVSTKVLSAYSIVAMFPNSWNYAFQSPAVHYKSYSIEKVNLPTLK